MTHAADCGEHNAPKYSRLFLLASMYDFIGKRVRVHLYNRDGITLGSLMGRVADVAEAVQVVPGMKNRSTAAGLSPRAASVVTVGVLWCR